MRESFQKNKTGILLMTVSSICACVGQLFWKLAMERGMLFMLSGFLLYGIGALIMLTAYRFGQLSVLQPMLSLNYVLSIVLGSVILKESVTILKCMGVLIIISGVIMIAGGDSE